MRLLLMLAGCCAWNTAMADTMPAGVQASFTTAFPILTESAGDVQRLELPAEVYLASRQPGLRDLAVFNAAGRRLPHHLQMAAADDVAGESSEALALFPLLAADLKDPDGLRLRVLRGGGATAIELQTEATGAAPEPVAARVAAYLLDRGPDPPPLRRLRLRWEAARGVELFHVDIQASADLQSWQRVVAAAPLADLVFAGRQLRRDEIDIPGTRLRYLRIDWPQQAAQTRLTGVDAVHLGAKLPRLDWWPLAAVVADGEVFEFENPGQFRIAALRLQPQDTRFVSQVEVDSRPRSGDAWRRRGSATLYQVGVANEILRTLEAHLRPVADRHWRLRLQPPVMPAPALELGWRIEQLVFVADGPGPYLLAVGNSATPPAVPSMGLPAAILERLDATPLARLGPARRLGEESFWRRWSDSPLLLWGVLLLGLAVMIAMVVSLMRQLRAPESATAQRPAPEHRDAEPRKPESQDSKLR